MTCWFFMSYARADDQHRDEELIRTFYDDLKAEVAVRVTDQSPPIAYLDQANLNPGDLWSVDIAEALRSCRTFVPIMTGAILHARLLREGVDDLRQPTHKCRRPQASTPDHPDTLGPASRGSVSRIRDGPAGDL